MAVGVVADVLSKFASLPPPPERPGKSKKRKATAVKGPEEEQPSKRKIGSFALLEDSDSDSGSGGAQLQKKNKTKATVGNRNRGAGGAPQREQPAKTGGGGGGGNGQRGRPTKDTIAVTDELWENFLVGDESSLFFNDRCEVQMRLVARSAVCNQFCG